MSTPKNNSGHPTHLNETKKPEGGPIGNVKAYKHGGEAALDKIQSGAPFTGLAEREELAVRDQLEVSGRAAVMFQDAVRLQTVTNLFWDAARKAFDDGNFDKIDRIVQRFGWLSSSALRAWAAVGVEEEKGKGTKISAADILDGLKGGSDAEHE